MYSAYKLNKQGDNIQPWHTTFPIWNQSVSPCPVLTVASWPAYRFLKRYVRWSLHALLSRFHLLQSSPLCQRKWFQPVVLEWLDIRRENRPEALDPYLTPHSHSSAMDCSCKRGSWKPELVELHVSEHTLKRQSLLREAWKVIIIKKKLDKMHIKNFSLKKRERLKPEKSVCRSGSNG